MGKSYWNSQPTDELTASAYERNIDAKHNFKDDETKKNILRQLVSHWMAEAEEIKEMIQVTTVHQKVESEREDEEMMATATKDLCLIQ